MYCGGQGTVAREAINMQKALAYVSKFNVAIVMCPNAISIWHKSQVSEKSSGRDKNDQMP